jgi:hypothetical protein
MTEQEWAACNDPAPMLHHVAGRLSDRKLRLFAVACCRQIWHLLPDERSRAAVDTAERYAEGLAGQRERTVARTDALGAATGRGSRAAWAPYWTASFNLPECIANACDAAAEAAMRTAARAAGSRTEQAAAWDAALVAGARQQAQSLREIVGNPFRAVAVAPAWLSWHGGLVGSMARQMYDEQDFSDLPILADALEDAGCDAHDLLAHCRRPAGHLRGCWALDLLLGKN